jgi:hypothetical protein
VTVVFCGTHGVFAAAADSCKTVFTGRASVAVAADTAISLFILRTESRAWITTSSKEAITFIGAFNRTSRDAYTRLACFTIGTKVGVIACCVVGFNRVGAQAGGGIAKTDLMTVIQGGTNNGITGLACGVFTDVVYSTAIGIITGGAIGLRRIVAESSLWHADTYAMALAECFADHGN